MTFLLMYWKYIAVALVIVGLTGAVKVQSVRLDHSKAETASVQAAFDLFKAKVKQEGEAALAATKAREAADQANMEKANAENAKTRKTLSGLYAAYRSLRDNRADAGSGFVPQATAAAKRPASACYNRADLDRALRGFDQGITGLLEQGDTAIADLNTAKAWAGGLK